MNEQVPMTLTAAIFDMDGLLLDTEPLWSSSMLKVSQAFGINIEPHHFKHTRGLRIFEVTKFWAEHFPWPASLDSTIVADAILDDIIALAKEKSRLMPGVQDCLRFLRQKKVKIGLATSSPMRMVQALIPYFGLADDFDVLTTSDNAVWGKPHPEVFLQCAQSLSVSPWGCVVLEDSVNGMVAAKAACMKVVVVPEKEQSGDARFGLADVRLESLEEFDETIWTLLSE
ncbi:MAG TPA: hexitol phosphatase HxpB [Edaphocola sp.]|nr:hexitol phosphatase HxpB [Edaphocola sp.]